MSEKHRRELLPQPTAHIEEETFYRMNLLNNPDVVIEALVAMEGLDWFQNQKRHCGEDSVDRAIEKIEKGLKATIYGFGGSHRYYVRPNGDVYYSRSHGEKDVDKAQQQGFKLN